MSTTAIRENLLREVNVMPSNDCLDVLHFIESLKTNRQPAIPETMLMSEAALARDWDTDEENEAWASL